MILLFLGPLPIPRSTQSPNEPRTKRVRRLSSAEEEMDLGSSGGGSREKQGTGGPAEVGYYGQSPASLSSQASWHSDVEHGELLILISHFIILHLFNL